MTDSTEPRAARELKNCPACDCHTPGTRWTEGKHIAGFCPACGCQGPVARTLEKAETYWNALPRPTTDTVERAVVFLEDVLGVLAASCGCDDRTAYTCTPCEMREAIRALPSAAGGEDKLREALEPFALVAELDISDAEADEDLYRPMSGRNALAPLIRVGDLRRARAALQQEPTK